jgi:tetratricopeptide (TPR) repeat protein
MIMTMPTLVLSALTLTVAAQAQPPSAPRPAASELAARARQLQMDGQRSAAIAMYRQVLAENPRHAAAHIGIGQSLDLEGRSAEAREHLQKGIELSEEQDLNSALSAMGVSFAFEGNAAGAATHYQRAFDRSVKAGAFDSAGGTANALGRVYLETGDTDNAEKWYRTGFETAGKAAPRTPAQRDLADMRWHHAQARIAARRKQFDRARTHVDQVRAIVERGQLDPGQRANSPHVAGYVAFYEGKPDVAIAELSKADQEDPFVLSLLAQAYEQKQDHARARELYTRILGLTGHSLQMAFARPLATRRLAAAR